MERMDSTSVVEIPIAEIEMEKESLAKGGFGEVYKAKWGEQNVAVKVIETQNEDNEAAKYETKLTLRLNHANVIKLFGITCVKQNKFGIVMEMAEQGSLDSWIGKIDREKQKKIAVGIIDGLEYVHSQKIIHRDIKPKNILMCGQEDDMTPKIADFGVSRKVEASTIRTAVGQELYMAPEVKVNDPYSFTADIYSLAVTLFEMFNEELLSQSSSEVKRFVMSAYSSRIGKIPRSCNCPAYLRNVIERGLQSAQERPPLWKYRSIIQGYYTVFFVSRT